MENKLTVGECYAPPHGFARLNASTAIQHEIDMSKNATPTTPTPPSSPSPTPKKVKLIATDTFALGGMIIAPGCEFLATEEKAAELETAGVAKRGILSF